MSKQDNITKNEIQKYEKQLISFCNMNKINIPNFDRYKFHK